MQKDKQTKKTGKGGNTKPIKKKDVPVHPDPRIDQDFPGYPHTPGNEKIIRPQSKKEKETADTDNKDGEKRNYNKDKRESFTDDGSANAFERTETPQDDDD